MSRILQSRLFAVLVAALLLGGLLGGVAIAQSGDDDGVMWACARVFTGQLRLVEDPSQCRRNETAVWWNQTGLQGEQGEQGIQGMQGRPGEPGHDGAPGTNGRDGMEGVNCWDLNGNRIADSDEDLNGDDVVDALDCAGLDGADGAPGEPGPSCSVTDNGNDTATLSCPNGSSVLIPTVPEPGERMFAVAYSNLNGVDGFQPDSSDVLIAKLVDTNADGEVSPGDTVVTGQYPMDLDATEFGNFTVTSHVVDQVGTATDTTIQVRNVTAAVFEFISGGYEYHFGGGTPGDGYTEMPHYPSPASFFDASGDGYDPLDGIQVDAPGDGLGPPSQPDAWVPRVEEYESASTDKIFIDVDISI